MLIKPSTSAMANRSRRSFVVLRILFLAVLSLGSRGFVSSESEDGVKKLYIAYMGEKHHDDPEVVTSLHHDTLSSLLGSTEEALGSIVYSYRHGFSGFAAMLTDSQAKKLTGMRGVLGVKLSQTVRASTTRSFDFLGLSFNSPPSQLLHKAKLGEDVIVGIIDTGIWPESKSFDDSGYGPVPKRWKGICQTGQEFKTSHCNRKIIGARYYAAEVLEDVLKMEYVSARDMNTHGTHVASTAAGSFVADVKVGGLAAGWARGGAPHARLAIYKVLWGEGDMRGGGSASVLKAIDDAVHDGVDVLNLSLSGDVEDSWLFPSLHATKKGISVVYSGGNDGPFPETVHNASPWVITVAASTIDRSFPTTITLGDNRALTGQAMYLANSDGSHPFMNLVNGFRCDQEALNTVEYRGKIVLCKPEPTSTAEKIFSAIEVIMNGGGRGLIFPLHDSTPLENFKGNSPLVVVDGVVFQQILDYKLISRDTAMVKIEPTRTVQGNSVFAPKVAALSSRGPNCVFPGILKPDIAAPGIGILAAVRDSYDFKSGTSMAAPHVAGIVALIKSVHPSWSPAAIKSAIMTTASVVDKAGSPILAEGYPRKLADPFDYGSGHINPEKAVDPGLVYDTSLEDYNLLHCASYGSVVCDTPRLPVYQLNLPSISIPDLKTRETVSRIVTNVGAPDSTYDAIIESPPGVQMQVQPSKLVFDEHNKIQKFTITFISLRQVQGVYTFGSLTWKDETHTVRIPIAVRTVIQDFYADVA